MPVNQVHGDETWDVESDSDGSADVQPLAGSVLKTSSMGSVAKRKLVANKTVGKAVVTITAPSMVSAESESESDEDLEASDAVPLRQFSSLKLQQQKPSLGASQLVTRLPPPEAAPKSSKGLATYLRQENAWLRNALSQLQQEAEKTASQQVSGEQGTLDFAHLLELAREFGEVPLQGGEQDLDDWYGDDASTVGPGTISMATPNSTPRGDHQHSGLEVAELQAQLSESRREVEELKALLAERDYQLTLLSCARK
jgi:hypothetical protein